jgi:hypothetical protein
MRRRIGFVESNKLFIQAGFTGMNIRLGFKNYPVKYLY